MDLPELLVFAGQMKATALIVEVGEPIQIVVGGKARQLAARWLDAAYFEAQVLQRLDAFKREQLRTSGRCEWQFDAKEVGRVVAEVAPNKATLTLPLQAPSPVSDATQHATPGLGDFLRNLFGRK